MIGFLAPAALLLAAQDAPAARAPALSPTAFERAEEGLLAAAAAERNVSDVLALGEFYASRGLFVEALAALAPEGEAMSAPARALAAICEYQMGRYRAVADRLQEERGALRGMALSRLGAYADASRDFARSAPKGLPSGLLSDYWLARAETSAFLGDPEGAKAALARARSFGADDSYAARYRFIAAMMASSRPDEARALLKRAASGPANEWSMRAKLRLAVDAGDLAAIDALALAWSGGAFDRELGMAQGKLRLERRDIEGAFGGYASVVDRFPNSDAAFEAQEALSGALAQVFDDSADIAPEKAAALFFAHVEYAPPGAEGDTLIQTAARRLSALDLSREAARLLEHQVFKRLRGPERSIVAADLSRYYLDADDADNALRVIRSTRIAGLDAETAAKRRRLEARALAALNRFEEAAALLAESPSLEDLKLRGDISWRAGAWSLSARDYASYFTGAIGAGREPDRETAVRAASAFLLAGDRHAYREFAKVAGPALDGRNEGDLIKAIGSVDRDQFLSDFEKTYQAAYGARKS